MDLNQVLIEAAKDGNMLVLKTALEKGANINAKDGSGMTALMYAEQRGYTQLADYLREKGAKEDENFKAIDDYTRAIELDPKDTKAYYNRGLAYSNLRQYQKAIDDYTRTIELDPKFATIAYYNRGTVYDELRQYQKAIDDCYQAGILHLEQKDKAGAQQCINLIKAIDSSSSLIIELQNLVDQI